MEMQSYLGGGGSESGPNHFSFSFESKEPRLDSKWQTKALFGLSMQSKGCRRSSYVFLCHGVALTFCFFTQSNGTMSQYYSINATDASHAANKQTKMQQAIKPNTTRCNSCNFLGLQGPLGTPSSGRLFVGAKDLDHMDSI